MEAAINGGGVSGVTVVGEEGGEAARVRTTH
jgi:hypothetical protein